MKHFPLLFCLTACALACPRSTAGPPKHAEPHELEVEIQRCIEQLGHVEFTRRETATQRLQEIGLPAVGALERGRHHVDREIRYRCERLVTRIRVEQRRRRLQAFVSYQDSDSYVDLPGWHRFCEVVGDNGRSRSLFAKMLDSEWDLLALGDHPSEVSEALAQRCTGLEQARTQFRQIPTLPTVAALLLLAGDEDVELPDQIGTTLYVLCSQVPSFRQSLEMSGKHTAVIRGLVGRWIRREDATRSGYYCLTLAMRHNLTEGVGLARRVLAQEDVPIHYREYAILTIAKLGNAQDLPTLQALLEDRSVCRTRKDARSNVTMQTEARDIALAAIIHLSGEDPKQFGFAQLRTNPLYVFVTTTIGFASERERLATRQKWDDFCRRSKSEG
jgi:hypothetical protein